MIAGVKPFLHAVGVVLDVANVVYAAIDVVNLAFFSHRKIPRLIPP